MEAVEYMTALFGFLSLDIITLYWVLGLSYAATLVFAVLLYRGGSKFRGSRQWILAQLFLSAGIILLAVQRVLPYTLLALGNTLVFAAGIVYVHAACLYSGKDRFRPQWYASIGLFLLLFLWPLRQAPVNIRTAWFSLFCMLASLAVLLVLLPGLRRRRNSNFWLAAGFFLVIGLGHLLQFIGALWFPNSYDITSVNPVFPLVILVSVLSAPLSLFIYFILASLSYEDSMREQQDRLAQTNSELRRSNHTKDLFVSILAHDLRNPVAGAARYVRKHLLAPNLDEAHKRQALEILAVSLERTHAFLENVLWWSRAQREDWALNRKQFDLRQAMDNSLGMVEPVARDKNLSILKEFRPAEVYADFDSVVLIFNNLLSNAIKFSVPGSLIQVGCGLNRTGAPYAYVTDHGSGIRPEIREKLLQIESKISTPGSLGEAGSGMGLIVCWEFARLNQAQLLLTSEPGIGTTVRLGFPPVDSAKEAAQRPAAPGTPALP